MSDDQTETTQPERRTGPVIAVVAVIVVLILLALWLSRDRDGGEPVTEPTSSPTEAVTEAPTTTEAPTATEAPAATPTEAATQEPTDADVAAFVEANGPAEHDATGDVDGDGVDEVVVARVRNETTHIVVGRWTGERYEPVFEDDGGSADRVDGLDLQDYNGEPGVEIVTLESVGEAGASLSIWGFDGSAIVRQEGEGGCWDGVHHFGISGATIEPGEIVATCDGSPLPEEAWSSDVYQWTDGAWTYVRTDEPGG